MQRSILRRIAAAVLALATLGACDAPPTAGPPADGPQELAALVEALGFRGDMVQDFGSYVLVEGDIYITKEQLRQSRQPRNGGPLGPRFQYRTTALVGSPKVQQITVNLSGLASQSGWQTAARDALAHWSGITHSYVKMVEVTGSADITVSTTCTSSNVAAFASFPSGGNPGSTVYVNTCFGYSTTSAQKLHNMVHEFGHTLGFRHSNYTQMGESAGTEGAVHIWNTPTSGNASGSVMNGGTALNSWAGFAASDLTAVRHLYPLPAPSVTLSNVGGVVHLSWAALPGALSYDVYYGTQVWGEDPVSGPLAGLTTTFAGNTEQTSFDTGSAWTGVSHCHYYDQPGYTRDYEYTWIVRARFANGFSPDYVVWAENAVC